MALELTAVGACVASFRIILVLRIGGGICILLLAVLSLLPAEEMVRTRLSGHIEHAMAYAATTLLLRLGYGRWGWLQPAAALVCYAGILEHMQHFSPGRHPGVDDWVASSIGVVLGSAAASATFRLCSRFGRLQRR
jgi:VanZ family protein